MHQGSTCIRPTLFGYTIICNALSGTIEKQNKWFQMIKKVLYDSYYYIKHIVNI